MPHLLVVDDEPSICWGIQRLGEGLGHQVETASSAEEALRKVAHAPPDVIVLDIRLPGMDGLAAMDRFRQTAKLVPIIVMTAFGDLDTAVTAVQQGAFEFLVKPFDVSQMENAVTRALDSRTAADSPQSTCSVSRPGSMLGSSAAMRSVFRDIALAAGSDVGVILLGESGTGKELAARAIHQYGRRASAPFVAVNVAALSPSLVESELFGHVKGSFTGANSDREGWLVRAHGGTLFLDEVAEMPLAAQVKLLRALELGEVVPVGSRTPVRVDLRVISATHQDLSKRIEEGTFRHDLYFRLGAFCIHVPPLRARPEDIPELADWFLSEATRRSAMPPARLSPAAHRALLRHTWRGNVRELRNAMEHATVVARGGLIQPEHLPLLNRASPASEASPGSPDQRLIAAVRQWVAEVEGLPERDQQSLHARLLHVIEPELFRQVVAQHRGQIASAARQLGLHRTTLRKKMDEYS